VVAKWLRNGCEIDLAPRAIWLCSAIERVGPLLLK
jgi:hypothetical protein